MAFKIGQKVKYNTMCDNTPITGIGEITFVHPNSCNYLVKLDVPFSCKTPLSDNGKLISTMCREDELQAVVLSSNKEWETLWEES